MFVKKVTKLWRGAYVSVRDYELIQAIDRGGMKIEHDGKHMVLSPEHLEKIKPDGPEMTSKFNDETYQLADILWDPN
jgi:hypothetical protein|tara:strand:+ start:282 stop:512 length:231 start_codon:yes stop_codon:yes gene_type:complete